MNERDLWQSATMQSSFLNSTNFSGSCFIPTPGALMQPGRLVRVRARCAYCGRRAVGEEAMCEGCGAAL